MLYEPLGKMIGSCAADIYYTPLSELTFGQIAPAIITITTAMIIYAFLIFCVGRMLKSAVDMIFESGLLTGAHDNITRRLIKATGAKCLYHINEAEYRETLWVASVMGEIFKRLPPTSNEFPNYKNSPRYIRKAAENLKNGIGTKTEYETVKLAIAAHTALFQAD